MHHVHHVHFWSLTVEKALITLRVTVRESGGRDPVLGKIHALLSSRFGVIHFSIHVRSEIFSDKT